MHLIRVAERLGASSRRPRHPFPALMAVNPGRVPVYTALQPHHETTTRTLTMCSNCTSTTLSMNCTSGQQKEHRPPFQSTATARNFHSFRTLNHRELNEFLNEQKCGKQLSSTQPAPEEPARANTARRPHASAPPLPRWRQK